MFFGYSFYQDSTSLDFTTNNLAINGVKVSNGIFDNVALNNILHLSEDVYDTTTPYVWDSNIVMNCNFNESINGGNIGDIIETTSQLKLQRREVGETEWITLITIYKNTVTNEIEANFTMFDSYAKNQTYYEYRILPIDLDGNEGTSLSEQVLSCFNGVYICDANNIYNIMLEYGYGNLTNIQKSAISEPIGSTKPFVIYNAQTNYDSGTINTMLLAPTSIYNDIDRPAQVRLKTEFSNWLRNHRAKILKDFNGELKVITITGNISQSPIKELGNGLASFSFDYVEVGEMTQNSLEYLGMLEQFDLEYK